MKKHLFVFIFLIGVALFLDYRNQFFFTPLSVFLFLIFDRRVFRMFLRWKFLLFMGILVFGVPLISGEKNAVFLGLPFSADMFRMSEVMASRGMIILLAVKMFTNRISVAEIEDGLRKIRLKQFSRVFGLSMQVLPEIRSIALGTFHEYRRQPGRVNFLPRFYHFAIELMVRILHFSESYPGKVPDGAGPELEQYRRQGQEMG